MKDNDETIRCTFIFLLEEYILLDFIPFNQINDVFKIIEDTYVEANLIGNNERGIQIKESCLNVISSILLKFLELNLLDQNVKMFLNLISMILIDIMDHKIEKNTKGIIGYKTPLITIFNRFIIYYPEMMKEFILGLKFNI